MQTTLIDGRRGVRSSIQIEVHSPQRSGTRGSSSLRNDSSLHSDEIDSAPILDFIASDETLDRYGEIISASGWRLDIYRRNPVFQNAHQYGDIMFTLGKALITELRTLPSEGSNPRSTLHAQRSTVLFQRVQFATDINPIARVAYGLYKAKFLNAVSVGFIPLRWEDVPAGGTSSASPHSSSSASPKSSTPCRRRYLEQELLEVSAVGIPANPNALALGLKAGAIERSDLREMLALLREIGSIGPIRLMDFARELHGILRRA
jgi:hypothetical protein